MTRVGMHEQLVQVSQKKKIGLKNKSVGNHAKALEAATNRGKGRSPIGQRWSFQRGGLCSHDRCWKTDFCGGRKMGNKLARWARSQEIPEGRSVDASTRQDFVRGFDEDMDCGGIS